jgi:hypothetical protein
MPVSVAARLAVLLARLTPMDLATKAGISIATVYRWRNPEYVAKPHRLSLAALDRVEAVLRRKDVG